MPDNTETTPEIELPEAMIEEVKSISWFTDDGSEEDDSTFKDYDITASPNDFNVKTIVDFIDSGPFKIPGFQRNYVWDLKRASKLIESLLIGLPIPQVFLYEEGKNSFLVIDGQQRLMSIYYFVKGRFPKKSQRPAIRRIMAEHGALPESALANDRYFDNFSLDLRNAAGQQSRFHGKNYKTLGDDKTTFDFRTIRNIIIKQNAPEEERDSSIFEIFNRLNTSGVNLKPQEIRMSMYHSDLMLALNRINLNPVWRNLIGQPEPDLHAKDTEILLRALAMTVDGDKYKEPMSRFLNIFARKSRSLPPEGLTYVEELFRTFFFMIRGAPIEAFRVDRSGRFSISIFEAVFHAACKDAYDSRTNDVWSIDQAKLTAIKTDAEFIAANTEGVGRATYVKKRYERARALLMP